MTFPDYEAVGFKEILVKLEGAVVTVTLNRPEQFNTFSIVLSEEIVQAFELFDKDDRVRVVILTAEPTAPAFCAGANITGGWSNLWSPEVEKQGHRAHRDRGGRVSLAIYHCRKITIAAVNGHAAGVGVTGLQLPFDFRFAWQGAKITFPFVRRGIAAEAVSSYLLPQLIGHSRATSLLLSGSTVNPTSHLISSLYHQILPTKEEVYPAAKTFANELAETTSQTGVAYTKALLRHPGESIEENQLRGSWVFSAMTHEGDANEGAQSFMQKRKPKFKDTLSSTKTPWTPWWRLVDLKAKL
ncbi:hypothetical protein M378DRAFT_73608 [Amanita muscaria Koide BX008]|uniref:Uncharacterized protein n=1 Tax=Amanita muscaria (strain Koide BX008) TaxID=946122 RepID=A0A0C2XDZ4_AMAMK|nr:hypothetical protein M378DRAFT_73608 [Amanita muscaria Koide BX008]